MGEWLPVGDEFIEADVIRWTEPVFRNRRRGRSVPVGDRLVTAEVLSEPDKDGWVHLLVRRCEALSPRTGWNASDVAMLPRDTETRRRAGTIARGNAERLTWSDESARALVASRFLNDRNPAPPVSTGNRQSPRPAQNSFSRVHKKRPVQPRPRPPSLRH